MQKEARFICRAPLYTNHCRWHKRFGQTNRGVSANSVNEMVPVQLFLTEIVAD
jgi:hypothetical protein